MSEPATKDRLVLTEDEMHEAEYKLQNCLRITLNVESFKTEVNTGERWLPVSEYVAALLEQSTLKKSFKVVENHIGDVNKMVPTDAVAELRSKTEPWPPFEDELPKADSQGLDDAKLSPEDFAESVITYYNSMHDRYDAEIVKARIAAYAKAYAQNLSDERVREAELKREIKIHDEYWHSQRLVDENGIGPVALANKESAEMELAQLTKGDNTNPNPRPQ